MIDFRIYRAGFAPALIAVVVLLFSLQGKPSPLPGVVATIEFDQLSATSIDREIVRAAPARSAGSAGDAAAADLVEKRFTAVREGQVSEQRFTADDSELRNVILTLPGESSHAVVVMAARDVATGPGAASSAAATATLIELADELRASRHTKTLVFVSTDGGGKGALGAREFAEHYPQRDLIDGIVSIWQPGSANPREPSLLDASDGTRSANLQLAQTAAQALTEQAERTPQEEGTFGSLARLALPSGLSEQAPLIEEGMPAIGLSSAGERPLAPDADTEDDLSPASLGAIGRAALLLTATIDGAPDGTPDHGPATYVPLAGNVVPGWALAALALCLIAPAALAAVDGVARALRRNLRVGWALGWTASRALPPLAAVLLLYALAWVGIIARPEFPFDPGRYLVATGEVITMLLLASVVAGGYYLMRGWRVPPRLPTEAAVPAIGVVSVLAVTGAWLVNPYLSLLLVPAAHVWLTGARRAGPLPWPAVALCAAASLVPAVAAIAHVTARLDLGAGAPWQLVLMVGDGQIGFGVLLASCLVAGSLFAILALALRPAPSPARATAGPPLDASPIAPALAIDDQDDGG